MNFSISRYKRDLEMALGILKLKSRQVYGDCVHLCESMGKDGTKQFLKTNKNFSWHERRYIYLEHKIWFAFKFRNCQQFLNFSLFRPILFTFGSSGNLLIFVVMRRGSLKKISTCFYMSVLGLVDTGERGGSGLAWYTLKSYASIELLTFRCLRADGQTVKISKRLVFIQVIATLRWRLLLPINLWFWDHVTSTSKIYFLECINRVPLQPVR